MFWLRKPIDRRKTNFPKASSIFFKNSRWPSIKNTRNCPSAKLKMLPKFIEFQSTLYDTIKFYTEHNNDKILFIYYRDKSSAGLQ